MYDKGSLHSLPGDATYELLRETHAALAGLLWLIEDLRSFDESVVESHFDDTTPFDRAQMVHRLLMSKSPKRIVEKNLLGGKEQEEFADWAKRCNVVDSFPNAGQLFELPRKDAQ